MHLNHPKRREKKMNRPVKTILLLGGKQVQGDGQVDRQHSSVDISRTKR